MSFLLSFRVGQSDTFYYSSQSHFDELLEVLRSEVDEAEEDLLAVLNERYEEIVRHMKVTAELCNDFKGN